VAVATAGNKILFAGGFVPSGLGNFLFTSKVDIYDVVSQSWSIAELSVARGGISTVVSGDKIFFAGGATYELFQVFYTAVDIYDASTNTWTFSSLSEGRSAIAGAAVGNKVLFAGGFVPNGPGDYLPTSKVDIYDVVSQTWSTANLSEPKAHHSAVTSGSKIYFAGGYRMIGTGGISSDISNNVDIYDNTDGSWSTSTLSEPKASMGSIALGGKVYWAGGVSSYSTNKVEIRDVMSQNSSFGCLFKPKSDFYTVEKNNKIVFFTGFSEVGGNEHHDNPPINQFDIYDATTNTWMIGVLPYTVVGAAIITANNTIYVAGGYINGNLSNKVWKLEF